MYGNRAERREKGKERRWRVSQPVEFQEKGAFWLLFLCHPCTRAPVLGLALTMPPHDW